MSDSLPTTPFRLTICGIDELADHCQAKVSHVLSILDPMTPEPDAFGRYGEHARLELRFHDIIEERVPGYDSPQRHHIEALLDFGRGMSQERVEDLHLLVHCHMGISRSTAGAVLILTQIEPNWSPDEVMAEVARVRPKAWPNLRMIELGDQLLGRQGRLVDAVRKRHREMAAALPHVAEFMRDAGRERELD